MSEGPLAVAWRSHMDPSISAIPGIFLKKRTPTERLRLLLSCLELTAFQSSETRRLQTLVQLEGMVRLCGVAVPGYAERLKKPSGHMTWGDFRALPILTREDLQDLGPQLNNPKPPPAFKPVSTSTTSGSTGKPIVTQGHQAASTLGRALQLRFQKWHGFNFEEPCAFITSPYPGGQAAPPQGVSGPPWAAPLGAGTSTLCNLMADTSGQLDYLFAKKPRYLATYPSNLQALVKRSLEVGQKPEGLEAIVLSSEPLSEELSRLTEEQWGARTVGTYSASEVGLIATQVVNGEGYYIQSENVFVEVLRDDGTHCEPGEIGRIVITTLQEFLRPLIRYEIGDYAEVGHPDPSDPVTLPRLRRIVGRERTMIRLPDGRQVWPHFEFASLVQLGGIRQWQLVQRKDLSILVRVVTTQEMTEELRVAVGEIVRAGLPGVSVEIQEVEAIERTARGKYLELISEVEG